MQRPWCHVVGDASGRIIKLTDGFDLERFVTAQEPVFDAALSELWAGRNQLARSEGGKCLVHIRLSVPPGEFGQRLSATAGRLDEIVTRRMDCARSRLKSVFRRMDASDPRLGEDDH
jgi:hypothetical protein